MIWFLLIATALASCGRPSVGTEHASSPRLSAIDSLMWRQPDSAFSLLLAFAESPEADSLDEFNGHYCQLLVSELLYKNDYEQTNREDLLKAVAYFDTVDNAFLAARAHYIKGVGYYERDSVVEACEEYLKALELMEERYSEKKLVGHKAKLMALTNTHLCGLFSDQYLHEQAIYFGKQSMPHYQKCDVETWHVPWLYREIGSQYHMMDCLDSADYYYCKAKDALADTCNLTYRDISTLKALLFYNKEKKPKEALQQLEWILAQAESQGEYYSRCAIIGEIYFHEHQFDSAYVYLNKVFLGSESMGSKKQAAEWLVEICKYWGLSYEIYADFLVPYANQEENRSELKSDLTELYSKYIQREKERFHNNEMHHSTTRLMLLFGVLLLVLVLLFLYYRETRNKSHRAQIVAERQSFEVRQKALGGRLKATNRALRKEQKEKRDLLQELKMKQSKHNWDSIDVFLEENICHEIMALLEGKVIKREAKRGDYSELKLSQSQLSQLQVAVEKHFSGFCRLLTSLYPKISRDEMNQCLLCLLNLKDTQIAALLQSDYSTVYKRSVRLKRMFNTDTPLQVFIRDFVL